jgi:60 kDa SS-A/Ro ribonucleoprotein
MANRKLFQSFVGALVAAAAGRNQEGASAYVRSPEQALAQFAATGCLSDTFYASAESQLDRVLDLSGGVAPEFVAKTALYGRRRAHMKDVPAFLLAALARRDAALMDRIFDRVVDSPRMLRTFVQIVRSGATGRKSLGTAPKRCVRRWLDQRTDAALFAASVGNAPSIADVVKMVHPKPATPGREALYGYLMNRQVDAAALPEIVRAFEAFKAGDRTTVPDVPFQMLAGLDLARSEWAQVARRGSWQMVRMNLNTFVRHGVFNEPGVTEIVAARLRDPREIARARVFPYQLLAAYRSIDAGAPGEVRRALEEAMELAIANTPAIAGQVYVCPDVSGSMKSPITGRRKGAASTVQCVDVAALMTSAIVRKNPSAEVLPFDNAVVGVDFTWSDSVMANAERLAAIGGGGTAVSAPLAALNDRRAHGDLVVVISDNESWVDESGSRGTATMREWNTFRYRNPQARLVLIDLQPSTTTQATSREDVLNVGGFSDHVFDVVSEFAAGRLRGDHWVREIEAVVI